MTTVIAATKEERRRIKRRKRVGGNLKAKRKAKAAAAAAAAASTDSGHSPAETAAATDSGHSPAESTVITTTKEERRRIKRRKRVGGNLKAKIKAEAAASASAATDSGHSPAETTVITAITEEKKRSRKRKRVGHRRGGKKTDEAATAPTDSGHSPAVSPASVPSNVVKGCSKSSSIASPASVPSNVVQGGSKSSSPASPASVPSNVVQGGPKSSSFFLDKMKARLSGGHFRMINEKLYTCTGDEALNYFKEDPALFHVYHSGYQEQMSHWPEQPNDTIIKWINNHSPSLVIADFGCGDARLSRSVKNKVYSFDLISYDPSVIACDMSKTPLEDSSVDVAVFCLSLMGTNFPSYIHEANRVLKNRGWLLIAEVKSRFDPSTGGADPYKFIKAISQLGFASVSEDFSNKMFILFYFKKKKEKQKPKDIEWPELKPCLYKRR
ncbi:Ribosomal RNA-processing protein 8 [Striga hermonthica]|uniref:Ribosomal RNA-processing protein 8 n=1 Tax=Striga hermonthica TaxID=68872 RepID=A0A9N7N199_STRHE|nr:Ribosomal RNA-processing protein 8 [Striga hermonthica]